jgi:hypothetical protein
MCLFIIYKFLNKAENSFEFRIIYLIILNLNNKGEFDPGSG